MMIKSSNTNMAFKNPKKNRKGATTTDKIAKKIRAQNDDAADNSSNQSSIEMNLGSYQAEKDEEVDPMDFIDDFKFSKRDFLMELFKEYNNLPIQKSLSNFAKVYNDVFVQEIPHNMTNYALFEIQIIEMSNMNQTGEQL